MPRSKMEVFKDLYETIEAGAPVSVELQEEAHNHGIPIAEVERTALACSEEEGDLEDEEPYSWKPTNARYTW